MKENHNPWKVLQQKEVYENKWISLTEYDVLNPSGGKGIYGKIHFKQLAIGIVPLDEELNTYLIGQYRFTIDQYTWEIPAGGGPFEEDPIEAAKRELLEEAGLQATEWTRIINMHTSNSVTDEYGMIFLARGLSQHQSAPEDTEELVIKKLPFEEAVNMVQQGIITDGPSIIGIQQVKLLLLQHKI